MKAPTCRALIAELKALGSPAKAKASAWFFKTGAGQYGAGDVFLGCASFEAKLRFACKIAKRSSAGGAARSRRFYV